MLESLAEDADQCAQAMFNDSARVKRLRAAAFRFLRLDKGDKKAQRKAMRTEKMRRDEQTKKETGINMRRRAMYRKRQFGVLMATDDDHDELADVATQSSMTAEKTKPSTTLTTATTTTTTTAPPPPPPVLQPALRPPIIVQAPLCVSASDDAPGSSASSSAANHDPTTTKESHYHLEQKCYACNAMFTLIDAFYFQLCPACSKLNFEKRNQTTPMPGKVALVTGARVKIGFQTALKLLREGATGTKISAHTVFLLLGKYEHCPLTHVIFFSIVLVTTRFPNDAARRYAEESDFASFSDRLHVIGVDFRSLAMVHSLATTVASQFKRLDILIHNAAQTLHRPPLFYEHLLRGEATPLPPGVANVVHALPVDAGFAATLPSNDAFPSLAFLPGVVSLPQDAARTAATAVAQATTHATQQIAQSQQQQPLPPSTILTQLPVIKDDFNVDPAHFPAHHVDIDGQQLDLRPRTTWDLRLKDVELGEIAEVTMVNYMAPLYLTQQLQPLLAHQLHPDRPPAAAYVINVSAMEGKFNRAFKNSTHVHTNSAKAALNVRNAYNFYIDHTHTHTHLDDHAHVRCGLCISTDLHEQRRHRLDHAGAWHRSCCRDEVHPAHRRH